MKQGILGFVLGCVLTGGVLGIYASGLKAELGAAQKEAQIQKAYMQRQQDAIKSDEQAKLQQQSQSQEQVTQQLDACQATFNRATFLYEQGVFGGPAREWLLPVDFEPVYAGQKRGLYSHYDPKTQTETVKFPAKTK